MVEGLDDKSALALFMDALQAGLLYQSLRNNTPTTYALAIKRANRYADTKEAMDQKRRQEGSLGSKRPWGSDSNRPSECRESKRPEIVPDIWVSKPVYVIESTADRNRRRELDRAKQSAPMFYRYHQTSNHSTEECTVLKREIESLI